MLFSETQVYYEQRHGVSQSTFSRILEFLIPLVKKKKRNYFIFYFFFKAKDFITQNMNTLTISERLELAKKYNLKEWKSKT